MAIETITLIIVDDQPLFRLGLRTALEQGGEVSVLEECSVSDEAVGLVANFQPRVVLVGTTPPQHRGLDICRRIDQQSPNIPVIVMTASEDYVELLEAIRCGACGYVSKLSNGETMLRAIHRACLGDMPIHDTVADCPEVARRVLEEFQDMARHPRLQDVTAPLSPREMELLQQLGKGRSNKEIANILCITPRTVKNHVTSILRKIDVNDRTQAVLAGLRYGWITLEESAQGSEARELALQR